MLGGRRNAQDERDRIPASKTRIVKNTLGHGSATGPDGLPQKDAAIMVPRFPISGRAGGAAYKG